MKKIHTSQKDFKQRKYGCEVSNGSYCKIFIILFLFIIIYYYYTCRTFSLLSTSMQILLVKSQITKRVIKQTVTCILNKVDKLNNNV